MTEPVMLLAPQCPPNTRVWKEQHQRHSRRQQGVHERKGVDDVTPNDPQGASVFATMMS
jgi:hypothetical protein